MMHGCHRDEIQGLPEKQLEFCRNVAMRSDHRDEAEHVSSRGALSIGGAGERNRDRSRGASRNSASRSRDGSRSRSRNRDRGGRSTRVRGPIIDKGNVGMLVILSSSRFQSVWGSTCRHRAASSSATATRRSSADGFGFGALLPRDVFRINRDERGLPRSWSPDVPRET